MTDDDVLKIEAYLGFRDGTWRTETIIVDDEGIFPPEDLLYHYMESHLDNFPGLVFYGIYSLHGPDYEDFSIDDLEED